MTQRIVKVNDKHLQPLKQAVESVLNGPISSHSHVATNAIDVTYAELATLIAAASLIVGQVYRMTDFRTVHTIAGTSVVHSGDVEVLRVTAKTTSEIETQVYSESWPEDTIHYIMDNSKLYRVVPSSGEKEADPVATHGIIYSRQHIRRDISCSFDWRGTMTRRWLNEDHSVYTEITDSFENGDYEDFPIFVDHNEWFDTGSYDIPYGIHIAPQTNADIPAGSVLIPDITLRNQGNTTLFIGNNSAICTFLGETYDNYIYANARITCVGRFSTNYIPVSSNLTLYGTGGMRDCYVLTNSSIVTTGSVRLDTCVMNTDYTGGTYTGSSIILSHTFGSLGLAKSWNSGPVTPEFWHTSWNNQINFSMAASQINLGDSSDGFVTGDTIRYSNIYSSGAAQALRFISAAGESLFYQLTSASATIVSVGGDEDYEWFEWTYQDGVGWFLSNSGNNKWTYDTKSLDLYANPTADGEYSGTLYYAAAGEEVNLSELCYMKSDGKFWLADADAAATTEGILAVALGTIAADASGTFLMKGFIQDDTWNFTKGGKVYVSTTTGAVTQTAPSGSGDQIRIVGYASDTSILLLQPDNLTTGIP